MMTIVTDTRNSRANPDMGKSATELRNACGHAEYRCNKCGVGTKHIVMRMDIGIEEHDLARLAAELSELLADNYTLDLKTHNSHWGT